MPTVARSAVFTGVDEDLEIRELPVPPPETGAVIVDVEYAGVCGTDIHIHAGRMPLSAPFVLGHEGVGRIRTLGDGVDTDAMGTPVRPGDAVAWQSSIACGTCRYCLVEREPSLCSGYRRVYGMNQKADEFPYISGNYSDALYLQPRSVFIKLPDGLHPRDVIPLGCAGPTAVHALLDEVHIALGDVVVVQGSGPVGLACAAYAQISGASRVIIVGGPASRLKTLKDLGVGHAHLDVTDGSSADDRLDTVLALTPDGAGADVVIEATGIPSAVAEGIEMTRRDGQYCVVGQYTDHGTTPINPHLITKKQLKVHGAWGSGPRHFLKYIQTLPLLLERFGLGRILEEYSLERTNEALADVRAGSVMKAVITPGRN